MSKRLFVVLVLFIFLDGCIPEYAKLNNSGYKKATAQQFDAALNDFNSSIKLNNQYWLSYANRGGCYYMQENYEKALEDFNTSMSLRKNNYVALDGRALCKMELKDTAGAIADIKQTIQ